MQFRRPEYKQEQLWTNNDTTSKELFENIYRKNIQRPGAQEMLAYLESTDFFSAPASTRFHGNYEGGLCEHSIHVYQCLHDYMQRARVRDVYGLRASEDTMATIALLHDVCKANVYTETTRNVKKDGQWIQVPYYEFNDELPYGHGEKSVYIISKYMHLTDEEAFAIRYHMGFSGNELANNVGKAFELYPLAFALSTADMEATYFIDEKREI